MPEDIDPELARKQQQVRSRLTRLRRQVDLAVRAYDLEAFQELSSTMRSWTEFAGSFADSMPRLGGTRCFPTHCPAKRLSRLLRRCDSVFTSLPTSVQLLQPTAHFESELASSGFLPTGGAAVNIFVRAAAHRDRSVEFWSYLNTRHPKVDTELEQQLSRRSNDIQAKRLVFTDWMGAEVVRLTGSAAGPTEQQRTLSRTQLIKRLANAFDGSHVQKLEELGELDAVVEQLLPHRVAAVPLPYFLLLSVANELLAHVPGLVDAL